MSVIETVKKYFTHTKPSLVGISKLLSGNLLISTHLMPVEENGNYSLEIRGAEGSVIYDHTLARNGRVLIEGVEFVPHKKVGFSFTKEELRRFMETFHRAVEVVENHFHAPNINVRVS